MTIYICRNNYKPAIGEDTSIYSSETENLTDQSAGYEHIPFSVKAQLRDQTSNRLCSTPHPPPSVSSPPGANSVDHPPAVDN